MVLRTLSRADDANPALKIMSKVLEQPTFAEPVIQRERARVIDDLVASEGQPQSLAAVAFQELVFAGQPYGHRESGNINSVKSLKRADLESFYRSHYSAQAAVIALIGDVTREQANKIAEQLTANLPSASFAASTAITPVPTLRQAVLKRITFPSQQSQILIGQPGVARGDPDYFALYVGNYVLGGGGFDSRLMHEVREKRGLTYSVYSYFMPLRQAGAFQIGLQTRADKTAQALAVTQQTLTDFVAQGVTAAELTQAQHSIIGGFPLRIDSNQKLLEYLAMIGFYQLPLNYLDTFPNKVAALTAEQIKHAFQTHIHPERMVTVVVGNAPTHPSDSKSDGAAK
jgi:zinc protease